MAAAGLCARRWEDPFGLHETERKRGRRPARARRQSCARDEAQRDADLSAGSGSRDAGASRSPPVSKTRRSVERRLNDSALRTAVARRRPVGDSAYAKRESAGAGGADGRASDHDRLAVKQERDLVRPAVPVLLTAQVCGCATASPGGSGSPWIAASESPARRDPQRGRCRRCLLDCAGPAEA